MIRPDPVSLYEAILLSLDMQIANGFVSESDGQGGSRPATIRGKRMVVPIREILETADWSKVQAFHPLCENAEGAPSAVLKNLTARINLKLNARLAGLLLDLAGLAADPSRHGTLSPQQTSFLSKLPDINEKTIDKLGKIITAMDSVDVNTRRLVNVYLKRGGNVNGKGYCRTAIVAFPIMDEFQRADATVWEQDVGKQRKHAIHTLLTKVLNLDALEANYYSTGSDSTMAPFFDAIIRTYLKIQGRINEVVELFRGALPNPEFSEAMHLDNVKELMKDLAVYKGLLPVLAGNDRDEDKKPQETAQPTAPLPTLGGTRSAPAETEGRRFPAGIHVPNGSVVAPAPVVPPVVSGRVATPDEEMRAWVEMQNRKNTMAVRPSYHAAMTPAVAVMRGVNPQQGPLGGGFPTTTSGAVPAAAPYGRPYQVQQQQPQYPQTVPYNQGTIPGQRVML